jgi:hypothetical protein
MKWEILKGSEDDFEGYHEEVTHIYSTRRGRAVSNGVAPDFDGHLVAERRPITEPDVNQQLTTEWDGNFPISSGTCVEVHFQSDDSRVWTEFRVEYMRGDVVVLYDFRSDSVESYSNELLSFRPIRQPEDVAREELKTILISAFGNLHHGSADGVEVDYIAGKLFEAGYRKVE